jgi:hypothetical protein
MPKVKMKDGTMKEFPYTKEGERAAAAYAKAKGGQFIPMKKGEYKKGGKS